MQIYEAISKTMGDVGAVEKNGSNTQGRGYKYRTIEDVMNALHPAMVKNGVFCTPEVLEQTREERPTDKGGVLIYSIIKVKYTFYAADGSSVQSVVIGEASDSGDKATNKAMSAAFKYACFQVFCIPTEEMIDSETESPQPKAKGNARQDAPDEQKQASNDNGEELATIPQKNAIKKICAKRDVNLEALYGQYKVTEETCTKAIATQILTRLNK